MEAVCVTFTHPAGVGALQFSAYRNRDGRPVEPAELLALTKLGPDQQIYLAEQEWGEFRGFQLVSSEGERFWRRWWLTHGPTLLFVTYTCGQEDADVELGPVNAMLASLRAKAS